MNIKIIYVGLAFILLLQAVCIAILADKCSISLLVYTLVGLQVVIYIMVGMAAIQIDQHVAEQAAEMATLTHDIRSPIAGIYQMSSLIYDRLDDPELKRLQKLVVDSSAKLSHQLESGKALIP